MKIIVGSISDRKIKSTLKIAEQLFGVEVFVEGYKANSGMPDTPFDKQTFEGSRNRALDCFNGNKEFNYVLGLESGLVDRYGHIFEEAWATVIDKNKKEYYGYSSGLKVPDYILKKINELKIEHSDVMTIIEEELGKIPNDTWGTYTGGVLLREVSLEESIRNAFIQISAKEKSFYNK